MEPRLSDVFGAIEADEQIETRPAVAELFKSPRFCLVPSGSERSLREIRSAIAKGLDVGVGDVARHAWERSRALAKTLDESRKTPDKELEWSLGEHKIRSSQDSKLEILLDSQAVATLDLRISVELRVQAITATIRDGKINSVRLGDCVASGKVLVEGFTVHEAKGRKLRFPTVLRFDDSPT